MPEKKGYIKLWMSYGAYFEAYSDPEVGRLVRAMIQYKLSGTDPEFRGSERFIWPAIKRDIDEAEAALEEKSVQNRRNVLKRWNPQERGAKKEDTEEYDGIRTDTKEYDGIRTDTKHTKDKDKGQGQGKGQRRQDTTCARDPAVAAAVSSLLKCVNLSGASPSCREELAGFVENLGEAVCRRAFEKALDNNIARWDYIRGILSKWAAKGIRSLEDIDRLDRKKPGKEKSAHGAGGCAEKAEKNWGIQYDN